MIRLILASLFVLTAPGLAETPAEWVGKLDSDQHPAAAAALLSLEPEASLPPLLTCVKTGEAEHAWRASGVLIRIAQERPKAQALPKTASELQECAQNGEAELHNRMISALSIRSFDKAAKDSVPLLVDSLTGEQPIEVALCTTIALGGLGKIAVKPLAKELKQEGLLRLFWSTTAIAMMGEDGKSAKNGLVRLVEDEKRISAFLVCRSGHFTLERTSGERAAGKSLEKRKKNEKGKIWGRGYGGVNFGAPCPLDMNAFFSSLMSVKGYKRPEVTKMSLPSGFLPTFSGGTLNLGDGLTSIALHLTKEMTAICEEIAAGAFKDWAEYQTRLDPVVESLRFLAFWDPFTRPG